MLSRLTLPPGVPGILTGGVDPDGLAGVPIVDGRVEDGPVSGVAGRAKSESTSSLTSLLFVVNGWCVYMC